MTSSRNFWLRKAAEHEANAREASDPLVRQQCEELARAYRAAARSSGTGWNDSADELSVMAEELHHKEAPEPTSSSHDTLRLIKNPEE
jgi:hypothetical protein